jgi:hypothetical protein
VDSGVSAGSVGSAGRWGLGALGALGALAGRLWCAVGVAVRCRDVGGRWAALVSIFYFLEQRRERSATAMERDGYSVICGECFSGR